MAALLGPDSLFTCPPKTTAVDRLFCVSPLVQNTCRPPAFHAHARRL